MRKAFVLAIALLALTSVLWVPAAVCVATGQPDRFQHYLQALDYLLKGLIEYFKAVIELFKAAVGA